MIRYSVEPVPAITQWTKAHGLNWYFRNSLCVSPYRMCLFLDINFPILQCLFGWYAVFSPLECWYLLSFYCLVKFSGYFSAFNLVQFVVTVFRDFRFLLQFCLLILPFLCPKFAVTVDIWKPLGTIILDVLLALVAVFSHAARSVNCGLARFGR